MTDPDFITPEALLPLIGTPDCPVLADVTTDEDFAADPHLIPTAFRHPHTDPEALAVRLGGAPVVVVCQKGRKLSQGMAAWLRAGGIDARALVGGNMGWAATAGAPRIAAGALPAPQSGGGVWVAGRRPGPSALGAVWLLRRFADPGARVLFVAPEETGAVADRFGGAVIGGEDGRDAFDALLVRLGLGTAALLRMAPVVAGAEQAAPGAPSEAAGLAAMLRGLRGTTPEDAALAGSAMGLFDALHGWAREEGGDAQWTPGRRGAA